MSSVGYKCYEYYTYLKNEHPDDAWEKKLSGIFHSEFTSCHMQRGTEMEPVALEIFAAKHKITLFRCGFIVNKHIPIFGYSPDALIIVNGEFRLAEVKCPKPQASIDDLIVHCQRFLKREKNGEVKLKEKCPYYGQIQLGMFMTRTPVCHFLVHHVHGKENVEIEVPYNPKFTCTMLKNLVKVYFQYYLPYVQKNYYS